MFELNDVRMIKRLVDLQFFLDLSSLDLVVQLGFVDYLARVFLLLSLASFTIDSATRHYLIAGSLPTLPQQVTS